MRLSLFICGIWTLASIVSIVDGDKLAMLLCLILSGAWLAIYKIEEINKKENKWKTELKELSVIQNQSTRYMKVFTEVGTS